MQAFESDVLAAVGQLKQALPDSAGASFTTLLNELERWNRRVNLTAIRNPHDMIEGHLLDSLAVRPCLNGDRIADIGTGAGFPGLPLAIAEPARTFTLVDSNGKKIAFVAHVARLLGLDNVTALNARTENYAPEQRFDTVIARAVGTLENLLGIAGHLVREDGVFVALKGRYPKQELEQVPGTWTTEVVRLDVPGLEQGSRHAVLLRPKYDDDTHNRGS